MRYREGLDSKEAIAKIEIGKDDTKWMLVSCESFNIELISNVEFMKDAMVIDNMLDDEES